MKAQQRIKIASQSQFWLRPKFLNFFFLSDWKKNEVKISDYSLVPWVEKWNHHEFKNDLFLSLIFIYFVEENIFTNFCFVLLVRKLPKDYVTTADLYY